MKELTTKHNSPKIIPTSSRRLGDSHKRISLHIIYCCSSAPTNEGSQSSQVPTTRYKNCKGDFIIKEINKYQMTIISKKAITITIIIHKYPSVQHTLNNQSPTFSQFKSITLIMMHAPDLNLKMQCGTIHKEIAKPIPIPCHSTSL